MMLAVLRKKKKKKKKKKKNIMETFKQLNNFNDVEKPKFREREIDRQTDRQRERE